VLDDVAAPAFVIPVESQVVRVQRDHLVKGEEREAQLSTRPSGQSHVKAPGQLRSGGLDTLPTVLDRPAGQRLGGSSGIVSRGHGPVV
jgi:hypothetical protein